MRDSAYMRLSFEGLLSVFIRRLRSDASNPPVLRFPVVVGGVTDAILATEVFDFDPGIGLFQDRHNLGFVESTRFHSNLLGSFCQNALLLVCPRYGEAYNLIFGLDIGQIVEVLEDEDFEYPYGIKG